MKRLKFTESQILFALKQNETGGEDRGGLP